MHRVQIEKQALHRANLSFLNFPPVPLFYHPICYLATPLAVYARLF